MKFFNTNKLDTRDRKEKESESISKRESESIVILTAAEGLRRGLNP